MQSSDNAAPAPREAGPGTAPSPTVPVRAPAPTALLILSPESDRLLLRAARTDAHEEADGVVVRFDLDAVARHATALLDGTDPKADLIRSLLRGGSHVADGEEARRALAGFTLFLHAPGVPDPDAPERHAEHAADIVQRAIARLLLVLAGEDAAHVERRDGRVTIDRACGFMVANLAKPLVLDDVVAATGASSRTLQYAFQTRFGMSPMRWLREQRLRRLHAALCDPSASQGVTELAVAIGFTHLGRLGQLFEQRFGLLPSHLLRRARRG